MFGAEGLFLNQATVSKHRNLVRIPIHVLDRVSVQFTMSPIAPTLPIADVKSKVPQKTLSIQDPETPHSLEDDSGDGPNPFLDPEVEDYWRTLYEKSQYECRHVFDSNLEWTKEEEKRVVRKLDWRVCLWAVSLHKQQAGTFSS